MKSRFLTLLPILALAALWSTAAFAQEGGAVDAGLGWKGLVGLGAGLAMGFGVLGASLGQGLLAGRALEGISRNPQAGGQIQVSMLLALAFPESLVLFALVVAYMLQGKV